MSPSQKGFSGLRMIQYEQRRFKNRKERKAEQFRHLEQLQLEDRKGHQHEVSKFEVRFHCLHKTTFPTIQCHLTLYISSNINCNGSGIRWDYYSIKTPSVGCPLNLKSNTPTEKCSRNNYDDI